MALTFTQLQGYATHAIGGSFSSQVNVADVCNSALRFLFNCHEWKWKSDAYYAIDFTANVNTVTLRPDVGHVKTIHMTDSVNYRMQPASMSELQDFRSRSLFNPFWYFYAVVRDGQTDPAHAPDSQHLELFPTPTATTLNAATVVYVARPTPLVNSTDVANVPVDYEHFLVELIQAYAKGYEDAAAFNLNNALTAIMQGVEAIMLMRNDGMTQPYLGPSIGGAATMVYPSNRLPFSTVTGP